MTATISRRDPESTELILDAAFVFEDPCPQGFLAPDPYCMDLTADAADMMWAHFVKIEPHRVETERRGECIHCGGLWFTIAWPTGRCERGTGVWDDVPEASWERFTGIAGYLEDLAVGIRERNG